MLNPHQPNSTRSMMRLDPTYCTALVGIIARRHYQTLQKLEPLKPEDVLPRDAFTSEEEWAKWQTQIGPDAISRAAELINEGHVPAE